MNPSDYFSALLVVVGLGMQLSKLKPRERVFWATISLLNAVFVLEALVKLP